MVGVYAAARPWALNAVASFVFWEPAHWVMQRRQFTNLKRRIEHRAENAIASAQR